MSRLRAGGQDWACSEFTETRMSGMGMAEEGALGNAARWGKGQILKDLKNPVEKFALEVGFVSLV